MIKAQDLRLNNIVKMPSSGELTKITAMDISDIQSNLKNRLPVEVTEEILLKVGFVSDELNGSFETFENGLKFTIIDKCGAWMIYLSGPFGMIVLKHIKFVHELQNLFNSLTGQELNTAGLI